MHRSSHWKHHQYDWKPQHMRGWSPWMGIGFLILLFLVFSKGLFWPLLFIFMGFMMLKGGRRWFQCEDMMPGEKAKRKNDEFIFIDDEQPKRKRASGDEDTEPIYYL